MDLANAGGKVLIGGTLVLAAVNGSLAAMLIAAGVGVWASKAWYTALQDSTDMIGKDTRKQIAKYAAAICNDDGKKLTDTEIKVRENEAKVLFTQLEKRQVTDAQGNGVIATLIGIGTFVIPVLGVATILGRKQLIAKTLERTRLSPAKKPTAKKRTAKKRTAKKPARKA